MENDTATTIIVVFAIIIIIFFFFILIVPVIVMKLMARHWYYRFHVVVLRHQHQRQHQRIPIRRNHKLHHHHHHHNQNSSSSGSINYTNTASVICNTTNRRSLLIFPFHCYRWCGNYYHPSPKAYFSSSSSSSPPPSSSSLSLKKLIQPFVMKCHPDMARQYSLPKSAQRINLTAIQNLNSYVDAVHTYMKSPGNVKNYTFNTTTTTTTTKPKKKDSFIEIEFVMAFSNNYDDDNLSNNNTTIKSNNNVPSPSSSSSYYKSGRSMTSRRRVELQLPPSPSELSSIMVAMQQRRPRRSPESIIERHVRRQLVKLLQIADLPVPPKSSYGDDDGDEEEEDLDHDFIDDAYFGAFYGDSDRDGDGDGVDTGLHHHHNRRREGGSRSRYGRDGEPRRRSRRLMTKRDVSRKKFWNSINWKRFDQLYEDALQDAYADIMTKNMVRDNPKARQKLLAKILSKVQFKHGNISKSNKDGDNDDDDDNDDNDDNDDKDNSGSSHNSMGGNNMIDGDGNSTVLPLERLVAYRRLLRIFDEHFDELQLEDLGRFWEELVTAIVVTNARPYNTSTSALRKRRRRQLETGYAFTVHHDDTVTIQVPIDFTDDELVQELRRNVRDFVSWTQQDDQDDFDWMMGRGPRKYQ